MKRTMRPSSRPLLLVVHGLLFAACTEGAPHAALVEHVDSAAVPPGERPRRTGKADCVPDCDFKECGSDGCGGLCGSCASGVACQDGVCSGSLDPCDGIPESGTCVGTVLKWCQNGIVEQMDCAEHGLACGKAFAGSDCIDAPSCQPKCEGKECGPDGCGGICGWCTGPGYYCNEWGICKPPPPCPSNCKAGETSCEGFSYGWGAICMLKKDAYIHGHTCWRWTSVQCPEACDFTNPYCWPPNIDQCAEGDKGCSPSWPNHSWTCVPEDYPDGSRVWKIDLSHCGFDRGCDWNTLECEQVGAEVPDREPPTSSDERSTSQPAGHSDDGGLAEAAAAGSGGAGGRRRGAGCSAAGQDGSSGEVVLLAVVLLLSLGARQPSGAERAVACTILLVGVSLLGACSSGRSSRSPDAGSTASASKKPPINGVCRSVDDQAVIASDGGQKDMTKIAYNCASQCVTEAGSLCTATCFDNQTTLSASCGTCYTELGSCVLSHCSSYCFNATWSDCLKCGAKHGCSDSFDVCRYGYGIDETAEDCVEGETRCSADEKYMLICYPNGNWEPMKCTNHCKPEIGRC